MTDFRVSSPGPSGLLSLAEAEHVADVLRRGGLAVLPTETGYMLAALASSMDALRRAFRAKGRDLAHPMHVACASLAMAERIATITPRGRRLLAEFTPGPLTLVASQTDALPRTLVTFNGTVGIRIPDNAATLQVVATLGEPVTATSLNRSGEEGRALDQAMLESLDWADLAEVPVVRQPGSVRYLSPSTLVRITGPEPEVLREGPVTTEEIGVVLAGGMAGPRRTASIVAGH